MEKSVFSPLYEHFRRRLVSMRQKAGLNQRELARKLGRERSFVGRIELGERRLDVVEFFWVCKACGHDPGKVATELMREFARRETEGDRGRERRKPKAQL